MADPTQNGRPSGYGPLRQLRPMQIITVTSSRDYPATVSWVPAPIPARLRRAIPLRYETFRVAEEPLHVVPFNWLQHPQLSGMRLVDFDLPITDQTMRARMLRTHMRDGHDVVLRRPDATGSIHFDLAWLDPPCVFSFPIDLSAHDNLQGIMRTELALRVVRIVDEFIHSKVPGAYGRHKDITILDILMQHGVNYDDIVLVGVIVFKRAFMCIRLEAWRHTPNEGLHVAHDDLALSPGYRFCGACVDGRRLDVLLPPPFPYKLRHNYPEPVNISSKTIILFDWKQRHGEGVLITDLFSYDVHLLGQLMRGGLVLPFEETGLDEIMVELELKTICAVPLPLKQYMVAIRDKVTKRQFTLAEIAFEICKALLDSFEEACVDEQWGQTSYRYILANKGAHWDDLAMMHLSQLEGKRCRLRLQVRPIMMIPVPPPL